MLYVCIPAHNEAPTVGLLLWRVRAVLREHTADRAYEVVVYDDASTDATAEVIGPYARVLPLTVLRGARRLGASGAVDALVRHVLSVSTAPDRDAVAILQADFTDPPEQLPALLAAFDAGADIVATRRPLADTQSRDERRVRRLAPLLLRPLVRLPGSSDASVLLSGYRVVRGSVLARTLDAAPRVVDADPSDGSGLVASADLFLRAMRSSSTLTIIDSPASPPVRLRASRINWPRDLRALARVAWQARRGPARSAWPSDPATIRRRQPSTTSSLHDTPEHAGVSDAADGMTDAARPKRRRRRSSGTSSSADASRAPIEENVIEENVTLVPDQPSLVIGGPQPEASDSGTVDTPSGETARRPRPRRRARSARGHRPNDETSVVADYPATEATGRESGGDAPPVSLPHAERAESTDSVDAASADRSSSDQGEGPRPARRRRRGGAGRRRSRDDSTDVGVAPADDTTHD